LLEETEFFHSLSIVSLFFLIGERVCQSEKVKGMRSERVHTFAVLLEEKFI
jgi:hypothetical protein